MFDPVLVAIWVVMLIGFNIPVVYLLKRNGIPQAIVLLGSLLMSAGIYMAIEKVLSYPMPLTWELFPADDYVVLAFDIRKDQIYLLLDDGGGIPRYYVVPIGMGEYDLGRQMAEKLPGMYQRAKEFNGSEVKYRPSLGGDPDGERLFVDMPQMPPPKEVE